MIVLEGYCLNKMSNKELDEMMLKALGEKKTVQKKLQEDDTKKEIEFTRYEEFQKNLILNFLKENNLIEQLDEVANWFIEQNVHPGHKIIKKWTKTYQNINDYEWNAVEFIYGIDSPYVEENETYYIHFFSGISFGVIDYDLHPDESSQWVTIHHDIPRIPGEGLPVIDTPQILITHLKRSLTNYVASIRSHQQ